MRGAAVEPRDMFSYLSPEQRVPKDHPLRTFRVTIFIRVSGARPFLQNTCSGPCSCKCSTAFSPNGN